jgi:hypothetical protein
LLVFQEEREKLIRLFPRLSVWLPVQDLVNGLVGGAPVALTSAGHQAEMVRWNWLRDYTHRFVPHGRGEDVLNLRVDGVLALCLRFTSSLGLPQQIWHTLLVWHCPLDDVRLLRQRLHRLLRWSESAERQPVYSQMPPVLILATSPHQAELWQQATTEVMARLRMEVPLGAVACLPEGKQPIGNSWRLPWRRLATDESCHLQDLVHSSASPAFSELMESRAPAWETGHDRREAKSVGQVPLSRGKRSFDLTAFAARRVPETRRGLSATGDYRLACVCLVPRQWEILLLCFAHPLLSRDELSALLSMHPKSLQILLAGLQTAGYLTCTETLAGWRWHLAEAGLRLLARAACCHVHRLVRTPVDPGQPLQQRGVAGLLHQARHSAGVYTFFATLKAALATLPDAQLRWWETGALCERVFVYRENTYHFKPDALASVRIGERSVRFWLEWDRGTMGVRDLESKCATYATYLTSRDWARGGAVLPALVCVVPEIAQERRLVSVACALLAHIPALRLYTTTASLMTMRGILAPIWQQVPLQAQHTPHAPPEHNQRIALFAET